MTSNNNNKINILNNKLNSINLTKREKNVSIKKGEILNKIKIFEELLCKKTQYGDESFENIQSNIKNIKDLLNNYGKNLNNFERIRTSEIKNLNSQIKIENEKNKEESIISNNNIENNFIKKMEQFLLEINNEKILRNEGKDKIKSILLESIDMIKGKISSDVQEKGESYDYLIKNLGNEILEINEMINEEKKERIDSHNLLQNKLNLIHESLINQIEREKINSKKNNETLVKLVELTCSKLEGDFFNE